MDEASGPIRIAVVGAGVAGLLALRHFGHDTRYEIVAFEGQNRIGGVWNYPVGCESDENLNVPWTSEHYSRMYRNLRLVDTKTRRRHKKTFRTDCDKLHWNYRINAPKILTYFSELPLFNTEESFVHRDTIFDHIQEYAAKFELQRFIKVM